MSTAESFKLQIKQTNRQIVLSGGDERKPLAHGRRASASSEDLCALTEK